MTAHEQAAVIISKFWLLHGVGSQSMNVMEAHEPAAVIILRFWHLHGVRHSVYEHHDST
ncbi:hypothetical protein DPMN_067712 [Dreissena polymorpha]|uniref:Uncharacterized protein n=1 Tax=Dreissena polymorpha TaxID=45954 RepID=A0A9D3Z079_DREPO|nr:hypothetical protein DPMN_067712 [Dreissena polymorpha]